MTEHPHTAGHPSEGAAGPDEDQAAASGPVIRDKRKVDPATGQPRQAEPGSTNPGEAGAATGEDGQQDAGQSAPDAAASEGGAAGDGNTSGDTSSDAHPDTRLAADRLLDLQRLQAEYVNYKRRVDRDRGVERQSAIGSVVESLLPVLDDVHSAREHGDLSDGPFAAIADKLESTLSKFGVEKIGAVGEAFDPNLHEALMHLPEADLPAEATETTIVQVMQPGFRVGERLVRPARVAVADPPSA